MGFPSLERWLRRGRRKLLFRPRVDFVYSRRYQLELPGATYDASRGERILTFLDSTGLLAPGAVHRPEPATFRSLRRVHTDAYLDSLNQPGALTTVVGYAIAEESADRILETQRAMVGGTILAARLALESDAVAVNLGGGLHHAFPDKGERFCVLNDVAVAIAELRASGYAGRILIVDLDLHDGDGTRAAFAADPTVHTFSIHNQTDGFADAVEATMVELHGSVQDEAYLEAVRSRLPGVLERFGPDLVVYLAGCDPAADDQIGNWKITAEGLLERDRFVLAQVREGGRSLPLVVTLAGGYGLNAWRYSARFLSCLLNGGRPVEPPTTEEITLTRYRQLAREIAPHELTGDGKDADLDDWGLTAEDLLPGLAAMHRPRRLLGYYSVQGMELALERAGMLDRLRGLGFSPRLEFDLDNPAGDTVRLYGNAGDAGRGEPLIEARVRIDRATVPGMALLRIEWLLMQNPRARFTAQRPRLPGQKHPGLGLLPDVMALLIVACDRLQLDGVLFVPAHYNTASQGRKYLRLLEPADEAFLRSLERALHGLPLSEATHSVEQRRVVDARTGRAAAWRSMPMVYPVTDRLRERVSGEEYERRVAEAAAELDLRLT